jgi:hypothetical protein
MKPAPLQTLLTAFGYGIFRVELVPPPAQKTRPNGTKDVQQYEIYRGLRSTGMDFSEVVLDVEDDSRAYAIAPEGHAPTHYELSQIEPQDWERIRTSVDMWGSEGFSSRVTMLEEHRQPAAQAAHP